MYLLDKIFIYSRLFAIQHAPKQKCSHIQNSLSFDSRFYVNETCTLKVK